MIADEIRTRLKIPRPNRVQCRIKLDSDILPHDLQGGTAHEKLYDAFKGRLPAIIVEVGSWKGASAVFWAKKLKEQPEGGAVICIDTWLGGLEHLTGECGEQWSIDKYRDVGGYPHLFHQFLANVIRSDVDDVVIPVPTTSLIGARLLARCGINPGFVYLDGSHDGDDLYADLCAYWKVLAEPGVMAGDDWLAEWPGVISAVWRFAREKELDLQVQSPLWLLQKGAK